VEEADIAALAQRLASGNWVPSAEELALGRALVLRSSRLEEELQPTGMPLVLGGDALWLTQVLAGQTALVREVSDELLPVWRGRLRGSAMLSLVEAYIDALRPLAPFARRLREAWERRPPATPDRTRVARYAAARRLSLVAAREQLWRDTVRRWEDHQLSAFEDDEVAQWEQQAMLLGAVLSAATATGAA